jgi:hypothetical protein
VTDYDFAPRSRIEDDIFQELLEMIPMDAKAEQIEERFRLIMSTLPPAPSDYAQAGLDNILTRLLHAVAGRELLREIRGRE